MADYRRSHPGGLLLLSICGAFLLMFLPLPEFLRWLRPNVIILVLVFWLIRMPESIGIGFAWVTGFVFDGMSGCHLGQHAFSFSMVAYIVLLFHQRVHMFNLIQQSLLVFILLALEQITVSWLSMVFGKGDYHLSLLVSAAIGALCWPIASTWLNRSQRRFASAL